MNFIDPKDTFEKPKYNGEKVLTLLKSLRKVKIKQRMSLKRQTIIEEINNFYVMYGYVGNKEFKLLYKYWFNFVMNDYLDPKRLDK